MLGDHSKQQGCIALSSAEAETYAAVAGLSTVLLHMSLLIYLGFEVKKIVLWTDSKAAKAIMEKKGVSNIRHFDVKVLWIQDQVERNWYLFRKFWEQRILQTFTQKL